MPPNVQALCAVEPRGGAATGSKQAAESPPNASGRHQHTLDRLRLSFLTGRQELLRPPLLQVGEHLDVARRGDPMSVDLLLHRITSRRLPPAEPADPGCSRRCGG